MVPALFFWGGGVEASVSRQPSPTLRANQVEMFEAEKGEVGNLEFLKSARGCNPGKTRLQLGAKTGWRFCSDKSKRLAELLEFI